MNGPEILFYIPLFGGLPVTETLVNSWIVMAFLIVLSLWLTHDMKKQHISKKQVVVETGVRMLYQLVGDTMGEDRLYFTPYIGTLFLFTLCANLMGLLTFRSPTADLNTTAAFAIIFFGLVQVFSIKANGLKTVSKALRNRCRWYCRSTLWVSFPLPLRWHSVCSETWPQVLW